MCSFVQRKSFNTRQYVAELIKCLGVSTSSSLYTCNILVLVSSSVKVLADWMSISTRRYSTITRTSGENNEDRQVVIVRLLTMTSLHISSCVIITVPRIIVMLLCSYEIPRTNPV